jgi:hypothetical protein
MSASESKLVFLCGSATATNATPVVVRDVRILASSFVMLGLPNTRAGANAGVARVSAVSAGQFSITGGADDQSVYPYYVVSSPLDGATERSSYIA